MLSEEIMNELIDNVSISTSYEDNNDKGDKSDYNYKASVDDIASVDSWEIIQ